MFLPLLSTFLSYHTHWENNTPTSASTYQPATFVIQQNVLKGGVKCPIAFFCWGSKPFIKEFLLCQVSEFTVFRIYIRYEKYPFEIMVVDRCYGGSSRYFFTPGKHKMCLFQSTLSYKECICVEIKF